MALAFHWPSWNISSRVYNGYYTENERMEKCQTSASNRCTLTRLYVQETSRVEESKNYSPDTGHDSC